jgi:nanoRNase/pAp phosphatase (c-di-AMP/oligoRNAs hydrolase)
MEDVSEIKSLIDKAKDILIVTHVNPTHDSMGSALSLYLGLKGIGKTVTIACPTPMTVEYSSFVGADKLQTTIAKKNFVISLDYEDGSIEKVSYNIEGKKFNLIIEPRPGFAEFSQDKVTYGHAGTAVDTIVAVDTKHLGGLGKVYEEDRELFATHPIINIDSHQDNAKYGTVNIVESSGTTSELIIRFLTALGIILTEDMATNTLHAIYKTTDSFQKHVTAQTFEVAAQCVKAGGKQIAPQPALPISGSNIAPQQQEVSEPVSSVSQPQEPIAPPKTQNPPEDWLKPKIYKSSNLA